jgi:hypothetical protein
MFLQEVKLMLNKIISKRVIIILICFAVFLTSGCIPLNEGSKRDTVCVLEMFNAVWLQKSPFYNQRLPEIDKEFGKEKALCINYYVQSKDDHPFPRLSCEEAEDRMKYLMKDQGLPTAFFNDVLIMKGLYSDGSPESVPDKLREKMFENIAKINLLSSPIKISGKCNKKENNTFQIEIKIEVLNDLDFKDLQLFLALTENNIPYKDISGEKIHYFVFREFLRPKEFKEKKTEPGIPLTISKKGDKYETTFSFDLNTELYKNELNIVAFVQDYSKKVILQGVGIPFKNEALSGSNK